MQGPSTVAEHPVKQVLFICSPASRSQARRELQRLGFTCAEFDDPYAAIVELARRPGDFAAAVVSLASLYGEELAIVAAITQRFPGIDVFLAHADERRDMAAEAIRLGATGILGNQGIRRLAAAPNVATTAPPTAPPAATASSDARSMTTISATAPAANADDPILTAEELRALLEDPAPGV
jgi:hypothetical protein